jgi:hypothetical protein
MPSVATITVDYALPGDFVSTERRETDRPINSLGLARYCLYNRDLAGNGLNNSVFLSYTGGFITQDNKLNTKYSDLQIKRSNTSSTNGKLHVSGTSSFFKGIHLGTNSLKEPTNTIKNARRLASVNDLKVSDYDNDPLTIKDFKNYMYHPGMITLFNGTWEDVRDRMPFWRICALPDAGQIIQTRTPNGQEISITIPNLLGKFLPGSQPTDLPAPASIQMYTTGVSGGHDATTLTIEQLTTHNHGVLAAWTGDQPPVFSGLNNNFYYGGGQTYSSTDFGRSCSKGGITGNTCACVEGTCTTRCCNEVCDGDDGRYCCKRTPKDDGGKRVPDSCRKITSDCSLDKTPISWVDADNSDFSVPKITVEDYTYVTLGLINTKPVISNQSEQDQGGNGQHENRPQFYGLVPIIYVGVKR